MRHSWYLIRDIGLKQILICKKYLGDRETELKKCLMTIGLLKYEHYVIHSSIMSWRMDNILILEFTKTFWKVLEYLLNDVK